MTSTSLANSSSASTSAYSAQVAFSTTSNAGESGSGEHTWQRSPSRAAATSDNDRDAGRLGAFGKSKQPVGGTMRGNDMFLAGDTERGQRFGGMAHGLPVGLASHDDGDRGGHAVNSFRESKNIGRIIRSARGSARRGMGSGMDYPVLVNPGKPLKDVMKKKTRSTAPGSAKRRKSGVTGPKAASQRARQVKVPAGSAPRQSVAPNEAKLTI